MVNIDLNKSVGLSILMDAIQPMLFFLYWDKTIPKDNTDFVISSDDRINLDDSTYKAGLKILNPSGKVFQFKDEFNIYKFSRNKNILSVSAEYEYEAETRTKVEILSSFINKLCEVTHIHPPYQDSDGGYNIDDIYKEFFKDKEAASKYIKEYDIPSNWHVVAVHDLGHENYDVEVSFKREILKFSENNIAVNTKPSNKLSYVKHKHEKQVDIYFNEEDLKEAFIAFDEDSILISVKIINKNIWEVDEDAKI